MSDKNCRNTSLLKCISCEDYQCKNLWGPIKMGCRLYSMLYNKTLDECQFDCATCKFCSVCSNLIREDIRLLGM